MSHITITRRFALISLLLLSVLLTGALLAHTVNAGSTSRQIRAAAFQPKNLQQLIQSHELASTVQVLSSQPPSVIIQFPLFPSGVKTAFPKASGVVTIVQGNPAVSLFDTVTVDVQNMPPDITFTIFFIELANKPFGNVEYVADLTTRGDGSGETIFQNIAFVAFAMDARNPGTSQDGQEGLTSGINLEHMGMWFSSVQDARKVLNDDSLLGTIFDGGSPPMHAGPQAMTDGKIAPVF